MFIYLLFMWIDESHFYSLNNKIAYHNTPPLLFMWIDESHFYSLNNKIAYHNTPPLLVFSVS